MQVRVLDCTCTWERETVQRCGILAERMEPKVYGEVAKGMECLLFSMGGCLDDTEL